jgi:MFS family permease
VGVLPALVALWVRRAVPEPKIWTERVHKDHVPFRTLLRPEIRRNGLIATAMNACSMFGYWGLFTWIPAFLSLPVEQGGRGLGLMATTTWLLVMGAGKWFGYASYGVFADRFGRRRSYAAYLFFAALLVPVYGMTTSPSALLMLGPLVAFFGTGYFSGFGTIASELFPTEIRATAMGISYNIGRGFSAAAPFIVGALAGTYGLGPAFILQAGAFMLAAILALFLPETKDRELE